jgi:hypothetical protein
MDNRLIFLYQLRGTENCSGYVPTEVYVEPSLRVKQNHESSSKKSSSISPYRKPTQVVKERILRCSSESWLRNSANLPCNFGKRGAPRKRGRREMAQATVYQKHMALQKRKLKYKA